MKRRNISKASGMAHIILQGNVNENSMTKIEEDMGGGRLREKGQGQAWRVLFAAFHLCIVSTAMKFEERI